ncbi:histidinol-phosphate transaminase [Zoogloea sp.]|jgi:histidinol-phosphate aminotransferase|uniref:histidinol-phosphate transaminase n=1 Tax=Zoogloea sp. TaxID=49181 RepID=UPI0011D60B7C|nr:histidinol-phosphate transaminase [Zoogloea sp.]MBK6652629.1 histidinol-phosphate transaminase [Zoogloea sp.]MBK7848490.1 histidinol-phosphate transaminase [Zoogloea sp.]MBP7443736.1 histidinol-phosphate transaminase [Zoogloea sp.]TXG94719.1 MAG: histidinol-phosphate transaminase [Zoogloea sp.]HOY00106.1 histidinol-phosphate transaminase [Zoogloea sp.]
MSLCDLAPAYIRAISPYQPGKPISELAREMGLEEASIVKLASNENPLGIGEQTRAAIESALADIARYPDGNGFELKDALRRRYGVAMDQIVLGNGSNDILELAARAFLGPDREAIYARHAFAVYPLATQATGARGVEVPAQDFGHDLDAMLAAITPLTRVIFIANPNNPTGTFLPGDRIEAFLGKVPDDVLVVLDEAYTEYLGPEQRYDAIAWLSRFPNLLISRTFSKAYGLAGLRVGYGLGSAAVIDLLNRVRQPFNVTSVGLAAAAAALFDDDFLARSYALNRAGMAQLTAGFTALGLEWIPSAGNFVTVKVGNGAKVNQGLLRQGVIVRPIGGYGMPEWLRVSIGLESENTRFLEALPVALG